MVSKWYGCPQYPNPQNPKPNRSRTTVKNRLVVDNKFRSAKKKKNFSYYVKWLLRASNATRWWFTVISEILKCQYRSPNERMGKNQMIDDETVQGWPGFRQISLPIRNAKNEAPKIISQLSPLLQKLQSCLSKVGVGKNDNQSPHESDRALKAYMKIRWG